jgi:type VII secretion-associated protein (TIGR03931 family)
VTVHRAVIETGPGTVRRLCCGTQEPVDAEIVAAALDDIDDTVTLVGEQPVAVAALWHTMFEALTCPARRTEPESVLIVYPSWWSETRVDIVTAAARTLAGNVVTTSRAQLLAASLAERAPKTATTVVAEIATGLVAITAAATVAEPRSGPTLQVADAVVRRVVALTGGAAAAVLIDGPASVEGAAVLAELIAERLRIAAPNAHVQLADDTLLARATMESTPAEDDSRCSKPEEVCGRRLWRLPALAGAVVLGVLAVGAGTWSRDTEPAGEVIPATFLIEGRVALQVPEQWPVQRVTAGPGSARVEVISPSDEQLVLHVTQSPVPVATLAATAESLAAALERANAAAPADVFVDFNPSGHRAGRSAVTYREVREGHHIDWTVLVDGAVRISIGCQSRPDDTRAVREVCEQAVRSARALG